MKSFLPRSLALIRLLTNRTTLGLLQGANYLGHLWNSEIGKFSLVLTNDADHSNLQRDKQVFAVLNEMGVKVTYAVFLTVERDGSFLGQHCRHGETESLANPKYRDFIERQRDLGHEIAYHGYSNISNTREQFEYGLLELRKLNHGQAVTYFEHGGNPRKHGVDKCKLETLAMQGAEIGSEYYVKDLLDFDRGLVQSVWSHHALIEETRPYSLGDFFCWDDGILHFRRQRAHKLLTQSSALMKKENGHFMGYTHFGYEGYSAGYPHTFDNWQQKQLPRVRRQIEFLNSKANVEYLTVAEAARRYNEVNSGVTTELPDEVKRSGGWLPNKGDQARED